MENWAEIRRRVLVDGLGKRAACREYDIHWDTPRQILEHPEPAAHRLPAPPRRPPLRSPRGHAPEAPRAPRAARLPPHRPAAQAQARPLPGRHPPDPPG